MTQIELPAADGQGAVQATWFAAAVADGQGSARSVVVVAPALSTPRRFYTPFCEHLAGRGFDVLVFDYRGIETGSARDAKASRTDMETWLRVDVSAAIDEAARRSGGRPVSLVGHSLGGMALGATPSAAKLARAMTVASGNGYPGLNPKSGKALWFLGRVAMPMYTRLFGYFPGGRLRKVGNLPRGVALQWSYWLRFRDYWFADAAYNMRERFASVRCPVLAVSFTDDEALQRPAIDDLHARYTGTSVQRAHLRPADVALQRIGHFGFFKRGSQRLWDDAVGWLAQGRNPYATSSLSQGA
jgi:predicted alpha/beta hydrolase